MYLSAEWRPEILSVIKFRASGATLENERHGAGVVLLKQSPFSRPFTLKFSTPDHTPCEACSSWKAAPQPQASKAWKSSAVSKLNLPVANIFPFLLISILFFVKIMFFSSMVFTSSGTLGEQ